MFQGDVTVSVSVTLGALASDRRSPTHPRPPAVGDPGTIGVTYTFRSYRCMGFS